MTGQAPPSGGSFRLPLPFLAGGKASRPPRRWRAWPASCGPRRRRWPSRRCASSVGRRRCASCWPSGPPPPPPTPCCAPHSRSPGERTRPSALHAGGPGGRGGQAPPADAQAAGLHQCLPAPLPGERSELVAATDADPVARWNHPRWWIARLQHVPRQLGRHPGGEQPPRAHDAAREHAPHLARAAARPAAGRARRLRARGPARAGAGPAASGGCHPRLRRRPGRSRTPAPSWPPNCWWQGLPPAARFLDACAAPGGKTAHPAGARPAQVTALDMDPARCEADPPEPAAPGAAGAWCAPPTRGPSAWWDGQPFDAILLDAPCTASGIVRRHPDVRWLRRESDIAQLADQQAGCWLCCGPCSRPAAGCSTAPARCSGPRARVQIANVCCAQQRRRFAARARPFIALKRGQRPMASRTI